MGIFDCAGFRAVLSYIQAVPMAAAVRVPEEPLTPILLSPTPWRITTLIRHGAMLFGGLPEWFLPILGPLHFYEKVLVFLKTVCYNAKLKCNARSSGSYEIARM